MVFSHGSGEGERLHLPLLGEPPLTADGTLRTCAGQGSSVPRSGLQVGDCVGCIVNSLNNCVHFTLNGYLLPFFRSLGSKEAPNEIHFEIGVQRRTPAFSVRVHMVAGVVNRPGPLPTLAFDVDAYSRAVGAAYMMTIHGVKSTPTEYGSLYGEMADDYHLLRRYLLQRGMAETLRHLDSELEELRGAKVGENLEKGASDHLQYALQIAELRRSAIGDEDHSGATTLSKLSGASVLSPEVRRGVARRLPRADPAGLSRMTADGRWNVVWLYQRADLLYLLKGEAFLRRWVGRLEGYLKGEGETLGGRDDWALRVLEEFGTDLLQPLSQIDRSALPGDVDGGDFVHVARQMEEANATEAEMPEETVMAILQSLVIVATPFRGAPSVATQLTLGQTLAAVVGEVACSPPHAAAALLSLLSTVKERVRVGVWRYTVRSLESLNERLLHLVSLECPKWGALSRNEPTPLTLRSTLRRVYGGAAVVPAVHNTTGLLDQQLGRSVDRLVPPSTARRVKGGDVEETDTMESVRVAKTHFETVCHCLVPL
ncbi:hypothetical protein AGDE_14065 [Angomonas deanei]|nr:hypothetical protein AGDE_14065 [Angomonas deanei]|eukprot:EPY21488.1 hypothetical protein AGDE_14065 [Angomonas deanei]